MKQHHELPLYCGEIYHIYNRTNNKEKMFLSEENMHYFLRRYTEYLSPFLDTYAYCLLPNHFHFLVKVKPMEELILISKEYEKIFKGRLVSEYFRRFFISYTKSFNEYSGRYGNLFQRPFKRKLVADNDYFCQSVFYINHNPRKHNLVDNYADYEWSSYYDLINGNSELLDTATVMEAFGGELFFLAYHQSDRHDISRYDMYLNNGDVMSKK